METCQRVENPVSLQEGKGYFLRLNPDQAPVPLFARVTFIGYTSCPAVVVVQDGRLERFRCSREDLFELAD